VRSYAETGVDFISVGALTHSSTAVEYELSSVAGVEPSSLVVSPAVVRGAGSFGIRFAND